MRSYSCTGDTRSRLSAVLGWELGPTMPSHLAQRAMASVHTENPSTNCFPGSMLAALLEEVFGKSDVPEIALTSATAPGLVHHWTNMDAIAEVGASAQIWGGFRYRFSIRLGTEMGRKLGQNVARHVVQPIQPGCLELSH